MFKIQGKIVVKETGDGIPGLIVHAFDFDMPPQASPKQLSREELLDKTLPYDSLGSVSTGKDGGFIIQFDEKDFNIADGKDLRPEITLVVSRPEDEDEKPATLSAITVYFSRPIRYKAGKTETYHIRVQQATLDKFGIFYPRTALSFQGNNPIPATHILNQIAQRAATKKTLKQGLKAIKVTFDHQTF